MLEAKDAFVISGFLAMVFGFGLILGSFFIGIPQENKDSVQFWKSRYEDIASQFLVLQAERNKPDLVYKIDGKNYRCFEIKELGE